MKKSIYIVMAFATVAIMLSGCEKKNLSDNQQPQVEKVKTTFTTVPQAKERTTLDDEITIWSENDKIKVFTQYTTGGDVFDLIAGAESDYAVFEGSTAEADTYYAAYPVSMVNGLSGSVISFTIPDTQIYNKDVYVGSFSDNTVPMVAKTTTKELAFKNVTGLLRLTLSTSIPNLSYTLKSITITDNDSYLSGDFKVDMSDATPVLTHVQGGGKTVSMSFDDAYVSISTFPRNFYFCLPVGALSGSYTIVITDSNDKVATIEWDASIYGSSSYNVELNQCKTMEETIEFGTPIYDACGNKYKAVEINGRMWLTENIHCNMIGESYEISQKMIGEDISRSSSYVVDEYGNWLYTWIAAVGCGSEDEAKARYGGLEAHDYNNIQGVCPDGFHIPSRAESQNLLNYTKQDCSVALKAMDGGWNPYGTNYSGFSAYKVGEYSETTMKEDGTLKWHTGSVARASGRKVAYYVKLADEGYYTSNTYCNVDDFAFSVRCVNNQ